MSNSSGNSKNSSDLKLQSPLSESCLRLRMSAHDGHYAGGLVDGARILQLFGDVATELLIGLDGDEGLFRAYESIEFIAPVFVGDYIEARGRIVRVGKTSRVMEFEARKVIRLLSSDLDHSGDVTQKRTSVSAAEFLAEPILVCKARGTCVTPLDLQRLKK